MNQKQIKIENLPTFAKFLDGEFTVKWKSEIDGDSFVTVCWDADKNYFDEDSYQEERIVGA